MTAAVAVMAAVVIVLSIVQAARHSHQQSASAQVPAPLAVGTALQRPRALPSVSLIDDHGKPTSLSQWRGKWVVLAPSMTLCHEVCPMTTATLNQLAAQLRRAGLSKQVAVVEATVDPWRDTPARLRAYRRLSHADFALLTGSQASIARLWKFFGVYYHRVPQGKPPDTDWLTGKPETFDVQHTDAVFLIDPAGQERILDEGMPQVTGQLPQPLRRILNDVGRHNLTHPQFAWTAAEIVGDLYYLMNRDLPASALAKVSVPSASAVAKALTGSPHPLAALHAQAGKLLPAGASLTAELQALHGYPVVLNLWASWCGPCLAEFPLLASASAAYGRRVAFLANDTNDSASDARTFLSGHPVSYPSFQVSQDALTPLAQLQSLPMTIFINRAGRVVHRNIGAYASQTRLVQDIERYALGA
jgi:protein SCO1/2